MTFLEAPFFLPVWINHLAIKPKNHITIFSIHETKKNVALEIAIRYGHSLSSLFINCYCYHGFRSCTSKYSHALRIIFILEHATWFHDKISNNAGKIRQIALQNTSTQSHDAVSKIANINIFSLHKDPLLTQHDDFEYFLTH